MKASDLFIKALENEGVEYIFGLPGEENLDFLESLRKSKKIKLVLTRHEQGAGFMAATYGRLTGKPGVCLATLGPGATNLVTPAAYAQLGAMPLILITGQKPIKTSKQGKFQIIDVVEMMQPLTKSAKQITHGSHIPSIVRESFRLAKEERPGAVHIELPEDIAREEVNNPQLFDVVDFRIPHAGDETISEAVKMIETAKNPLILIGAGANRKRASKALTEFVDAIGIPFFNTQMGEGIINERHPLYLGTAALSDYDFLHEAISHSDLIINVGHDTIEKPPFFMHPDDKRKVIHLNFFPAEIDEVYFPQLNVIGDIADSVLQLTKQLKPNANKWNTDFFLSVKENVTSHLTKYEKDDRFPILPQRMVKITRDVLPDDGIVTLDNGVYKIWFARNYPAYLQNSVILDNALATMGAGLASAMMAKELYPDRKVISVNGDGGFMMNSQELETAVRLGLDLVVIILNDNAYGMIQWKQEGEGFPKYGLDYGNPDFVKYAESFGATGYRPDSVEDFKNTLQTALNSKGVQVIDLAVDYSLNHEILNVLIKEYSKNLKK
ncbi:acetolactate synthase large subunit [Aureibaculum sp. 2210JD6-5]|uniref:acetolactate synthase large subunit n=1 Tax=Aureibaculum sp. 2210JD6-5 TaxID=3103957 RepID=UPI002AAE557F|nr:acetolactate synthase large subunit [Aureibaculum sp. 2210JD6-5]MDY7396082.1 acetolactate synthase large subunit [Aureibaculum sp. 2210JD6-5]